MERVVASRYRLTERLGGGGMGVVWQAHDQRLRRTVAVKEVILPPSLDESRLEEIRRRTMREGRIAAKLHHPQLIAVYDVIEDDGRPYLIMEYLPSTSLSRLLTERGPRPPEEVARIGAQAAAALASAHEAGVVHRDVKPANVLVGDDDTVKITDFGVSRVVEDVTGTTTGTFVGTPAYLAPEVAQGREVTFAADVYSLGATLYTAVEGTPPAGRSDNPMLLLHRIASGEVVPPKQAGPLAGILLRLLAADPARRPTMAQARDALAGIADGQEPAPEDTAAPVPPPPDDTTAAYVPPVAVAGPATGTPQRRRARAIVALATLFVVVAVTTTLLVLSNTGDAPKDGNGNAAQPPASESTDSSPPSESSASTATEESTQDDPAPSSAEGTPTRRIEPPVAPPPPARTPTNAVAAVTDYYALMPGNPDEGWTRLTPRFQQSPAGGRENYLAYWGSIASVRASQAGGQGNTVEVTIDYVFKDGRNYHERHRYGLVNQGGRWLLDTVAVLSSTTS